MIKRKENGKRDGARGGGKSNQEVDQGYNLSKIARLLCQKMLRKIVKNAFFQ